MKNDIQIFDVRTADRDTLVKSWQWERDWILAQAWQLMIDIASTNQNRFPDEPINLNFHGLQEIIDQMMESKTECPYFKMREEREEMGWL